jgi:hypothetical protein
MSKIFNFPKIILIFLLGCLISCYAVGEGQFPKPTDNPPYIHKYVHIDPSFNAVEKAVIKRSFEEWSRVTKGFVQWTYVDWRNYDVNSRGFECSKHLLVIRYNSIDPTIKTIENKLDYTIAGYANNSSKTCGLESIYLVVDSIKTVGMLRLVMLHEIGHNLGLSHNSKVSIMNTRIVYKMYCITTYDLQQFCSNWGCDYTTFQLCDGK